jgi:hypothetical protein
MLAYEESMVVPAEATYVEFRRINLEEELVKYLKLVIVRLMRVEQCRASKAMRNVTCCCDVKGSLGNCDGLPVLWAVCLSVVL